MIRRSQFSRVLAYVQDCGAADYAEQIMRPRGVGGRPRQIPFAVFFTALIIAAEEEKALSLVNVHKVLTRDLARSFQISLGIIERRRDGTQHTLTLRQVRYMLEALEKKLAYTQGRAPELSDADRETRYRALNRFYDLLTDGTRLDHLPPAAAYATDTTGIASYANGHRRRHVVAIDPQADHASDASSGETVAGGDTTSTAVSTTEATPIMDGKPTAQAPVANAVRRAYDPDARFGYQTKTYNNNTKVVFGYHALALIPVLPVGADPTDGPKLLERFRLQPANANAVTPTLEMLDSLLDAGRPVTELLSDREYSYKTSETWADQLRARDIAQVIDVHDNDRGIRDFNGIAIIDGTPHCRAVIGDREDLIRIPRPANLSPGTLPINATEEERAKHAARVEAIAEFRRKIAERQVAAFRRVASADEEGNERWECPAQAGKVICANCPLSLDYPDTLPVVTSPHDVPALPDPPAKPAKGASPADKAAYRTAKAQWDGQADFLRCCRQRTITIPGAASAKLRQQHTWGSDAWIESYNRRSHVEGWFGNYKSSKTTGVIRGWIFVVGIVKTGIMLIAAGINNNIRLMRSWAAKTGDRTHPLCALDPESFGFEELDADGNPDLALAPPTAA